MNVRYWHLADMDYCTRTCPLSGVKRTCRFALQCPLLTQSGHFFPSSSAFTATVAVSLGAEMKRREVIKLIGGAAVAWPLGARAQQATKIPQIGVLSLGRGDESDASLATLDAFMAALHELDYTEGQNVAFDRKFAGGDTNKLSGLAQELVERRVDAIVVLATPAARAAKQATSSIPIIAIGMADPVDDELVSSLARPGGNVTGTAFLGPELVSKRLQLLKEIVPHLSRVVVLWHPRAYGERTMAGMLKEIESAAQSLGTKLQLVPAVSPDDFSSAFAAMTTERADGLIVFPSPMLFSQYSRIVTFAGNNHLPAMYAAREGVAARRSCLIRSKPARSVPRDRDLFGQNPQRGKTC